MACETVVDLIKSSRTAALPMRSCLSQKLHHMLSRGNKPP